MIYQGFTFTGKPPKALIPRSISVAQLFSSIIILTLFSPYLYLEPETRCFLIIEKQVIKNIDPENTVLE